MRKKYLTLEEAFSLSHISVDSLRRKIKAGLIPAYRPGKKILIEEKDLEIFIKKNRMSDAS